MPTDVLEKIVIAEDGAGRIVVFEGTPEKWRDFSFDNHHTVQTYLKRLLRRDPNALDRLQNGPSVTDPDYWKCFSALDPDMYSEVLEQAKKTVE